MPITFVQPSPVMPNVAEGYGAAKQYSQDLPTLAGMQEAAARLGMEAASRRGGGGGGGGDSGALQERAREFDINQRVGQNQYDQELSTRANIAQYQGALALTAQSQHAQLQNWLADQDMTRQDTQRITQMRNALSQVQEMRTNRQMTDAEADQAIIDIKTPLQVLQARQQRATLQQLQTHTQLQSLQVQNMTRDQQEAAAFKAKSAQARLSVIHSPTMMSEELAKAKLAWDQVNPGTPFDPNNPDIMKAAQLQVEKRGGAFHMLETEPGKSVPIDFGAKAAELQMKHYEVESKQHDTNMERYNKALQDREKQLRESLWGLDKTPEEIHDKAMRTMVIPHPGLAPLTPAQRMDPEKVRYRDTHNKLRMTNEGFARSGGAGARFATDSELDSATREEMARQQATPPVTPAPAPTIPGGVNRPLPVNNVVPQQRQMSLAELGHTSSNVLDAALSRTPTLPIADADKTRMDSAILQGKKLLAKSKDGYKGLSEADKKTYMELERDVERILAKPIPRTVAGIEDNPSPFAPPQFGNPLAPFMRPQGAAVAPQF